MPVVSAVCHECKVSAVCHTWLRLLPMFLMPKPESWVALAWVVLRILVRPTTTAVLIAVITR